MYKFIISLLFLLLGFKCHGRLLLDVSIINKKGIDIGLTLGSELHSTEEVEKRKSIILTMKSGMKVILETRFLGVENSSAIKSDKIIYGPLPYVQISGEILDTNGQVIKDFRNEPLYVSLENETNITHSQETQLTQLRLRPYVK